jgi:hypothetical protein
MRLTMSFALRSLLSALLAGGAILAVTTGGSYIAKHDDYGMFVLAGMALAVMLASTFAIRLLVTEPKEEEEPEVTYIRDV